MTVYILIEERDQPEFVDNYGEEAVPCSSIFGVYADRDRAENEKARLEEEERNKVELETDPCSYYIEERPVLT